MGEVKVEVPVRGSSSSCRTGGALETIMTGSPRFDAVIMDQCINMDIISDPTVTPPPPGAAGVAGAAGAADNEDSADSLSDEDAEELDALLDLLDDLDGESGEKQAPVIDYLRL